MKKKYLLPFIVFIFAILGGFLRFYAVNWDSFYAFHPDERNISWAVTRIRFFDQMNPKFFAYGGLPVYLYRAIGEAVVSVTNNPEWLQDWGHIAVIGRYVSATLSTISLLLIYLVASSYFTRVAGLASVAFLAFSPWAIQQAHFATTETMLVFFLLLLLWLSHSILSSSRIRGSALLFWTNADSRLRGNDTEKNWSIGLLVVLGIVWGLALAAKTTALSFGIIPITALWLSTFRKPFSLEGHFLSRLLRNVLLTLLLSFTALLTFTAFSPYTVLDFTHFRESMIYEGGVVSGRLSVPYTLQFTGTVPYLHQLQTMLWQGGMVTIVGIFGCMLLVFETARGMTIVRSTEILLGKIKRAIQFIGRRISLSEAAKHLRYTHDSRTSPNNASSERIVSNLIFLLFPLTYFLIIGSWFAKFNRYNTLILPFLAISAAWLSAKCIKTFRVAGLAFTALLLCSSLVWSMANWSIYLKPQTRIAASEWIYQNIPETAKLYTEHWNDGLPLDLPNQPIHYQRELLEAYERPDDERKVEYYATKLPVGDYIILSTRRIWATMPKLKEQYPVTSLFYEMLLNGELGYTEVATFTSHPRLFGYSINDDAVEESLQVFDHPTVRIFQNTERLSYGEMYKILQMK